MARRYDPEDEFLLNSVSENLQSLYTSGIWNPQGNQGYDRYHKKAEDMSFRSSIIESILNSDFLSLSNDTEKVEFFYSYFDTFSKRSLLRSTLEKKLNTLTNTDLVNLYVNLPSTRSNPNFVSDENSVENTGSYPVEGLESESDLAEDVRPGGDDSIEGDGVVRQNKPWIKVKKGSNPSLRSGERVVNGKYIINENLLNNANTLEVRYAKNRHLCDIRPQYVGGAVKRVISHAIKDGVAELNTADLKELQSQERYLVKRVLNRIGKGHLMNDDGEFMKELEVLHGSFRAGNTSELLKARLRKMIHVAMLNSLIPRSTCQDMLIELD
jgi:hypothetical protein